MILWIIKSNLWLTIIIGIFILINIKIINLNFRIDEDKAIIDSKIDIK